MIGRSPWPRHDDEAVTRVIESVSVKDASAEREPSTSQRPSQPPGERAETQTRAPWPRRVHADSRRRRLAVTDGFMASPVRLSSCCADDEHKGGRNAAIQ